VPAVPNRTGRSEWGFIAKALSPKFNPNMRPVPKFVKEGAPSGERGEYLANGPAMCVGCHTPFNVMKGMEPAGPAFSGAFEPDPDPTDPSQEIIAPNIKADPKTGILGNYTEDDIKEAARAFTGWGHDGDDFVFRKYDHDNGEKKFFGRKGNLDGDDVIDAILEHRACASYIAGKLFAFFGYENPEPEITQGLGQVLRENDWNLRPLLRTMFTSQAFYSDKAIGTQIKSQGKYGQL
jgi:hypothetical protein